MPVLLNPSAVLGCESINVSQLLTGSFYLVPDYQREFEWTDEQFEQLWEDIKQTYEKNFNQGRLIPQPLPHFLGAIVVQSPHHNSLSQREEIIDGQQRIVTLNCFISVLCEFAEQVRDKRKREYLTNFLSSMLGQYAGGEIEPRVFLDREKDFFIQSVIDNKTHEQRQKLWSTQDLSNRNLAIRLQRALIYFYGQIKEFISEDIDNCDEKIETLVQVISELIIMIKLTVADFRMAYPLFEALNYRGLVLSQADLLKNELLKRATEENARDKVAQRWLDMLEDLGGQNRVTLPEFLQYHFISKYGSVKASLLFEEISKYLKQEGISAKSYSLNIKEEASHFINLINGNNNRWTKQANLSLNELIEPLNIKFSYPLLLSAAARFVNEPKLFSKMAVITKNFCFRFLIIQSKTPNSLERVIGQAARMLRDPTNNPEQVVSLLKTASSDLEFKDKFKDFRFKTNKLGFYAVWSIEEHLSAGSGISVNKQSPKQHLEHIMPQEISQDWKHIDTDAPSHKKYLNGLGNLLVLESNINSFIRNKSFEFKVSNQQHKDYESSALKLPSSVKNYLDNGQWTFKSIQARQNDLVESYACLVWSLDW